MKSPIKCYESSGLLALIEEKKSILTNQVNQYGFTHQQTLAASQELDQLLNRYQFGDYEESHSTYSM